MYLKMLQGVAAALELLDSIVAEQVARGKMLCSLITIEIVIRRLVSIVNSHALPSHAS